VNNRLLVIAILVLGRVGSGHSSATKRGSATGLGLGQRLCGSSRVPKNDPRLILGDSRGNDLLTGSPTRCLTTDG